MERNGKGKGKGKGKGREGDQSGVPATTQASKNAAGPGPGYCIQGSHRPPRVLSGLGPLRRPPRDIKPTPVRSGHLVARRLPAQFHLPRHGKQALFGLTLGWHEAGHTGDIAHGPEYRVEAIAARLGPRYKVGGQQSKTEGAREHPWALTKERNA